MARKNYTFFLDNEIIKSGKLQAELNTLTYRSFNQFVEQAIANEIKKSQKLTK